MLNPEVSLIPKQDVSVLQIYEKEWNIIEYLSPSFKA